MSVSDAFRNMLNRIADHFLDTAARMMANQLQQGLLGLLSNIFIPNPYGVKPGQSLYDIPTPSRFTDMTVGVRANGGVVNAGKSYMVGERGAEMFVPNAGGRIVPNSDLGGSTTVVVNVDASGSSVEGDEEQGRQLGLLISSAVQSEIIQQQRPGGLLA
jgi:phage-related minor tail protein